MRIVFFTREGYETDPLFRYIYAHVAAAFPDSHVVAVTRPRATLRRRLHRFGKVVRRRGIAQTLELLSSKPLQWLISSREGLALDRALRELARPVAPPPASTALVDTVNGADSIQTLTALHPDIVLQSGAGILRAAVFSIASVATINMHHGIAPDIRGVNSIYWALYENKPEWLGATVHRIDDGIDTGAVLAYAPLETRLEGEGFASLFTRATQAGTAELLVVLKRLAAGERWTVPSRAGPSAYRSSMSGWRLAFVELLLWRERRGKRKLPPTATSPYSSVQTNIR
jgi:folate-dependent phosphoribosylglycinamide formyltransferase PurN